MSLDSPPFYDPWFAKARTTGAIEAREMDEGMVGAASRLPRAAAVPADPRRARRGRREFWGDELKTVRSPYPTGDGYEELIAMPALNLDAAFVHLNLGDKHGNAAYNGVDPYFDDLLLMAAEKRYVSRRAGGATEELVESRSAAAAAAQPDDGRRRRRGPERRPLHHRRTGLRPRREVPASLRRGRRDPRDVAAVRRHVPVRQRGRLPGRRQEVRSRSRQTSE